MHRVIGSRCWSWSPRELGRLIGVVVSGARASYVPVRIARDVIEDIRDEMLVVIEDFVEDRRYLGTLRGSVKLDIAIDSSSLPSTFDPEKSLQFAAPMMKTFVEILGEIPPDGGIELSFAIPRPGSRVYLVERGEPLSKILRIPRGLNVGVHRFSGMRVELDPRAIDYHMAVVGATGSGKSRLVKALIEEILLNTSYSVIVFDHTGIDYAQVERWRRLAEEAGIEPYVVDGSKIILDPITVAELMIERARVPRNLEDHVTYSVIRYVQDAASMSGDGAVPTAAPHPAAYGRYGRGVNAIDAALVEQQVERYFDIMKRGGGVWSFDRFLNSMVKYLTELNARDSTMHKLSMLIALNLGRRFFSDYLDSRNVDVRDIVDDLLTKRRRLVVVDLSSEVEYVAKRYVVAQVLRWVWERVLSERRRAEVVAVIDEAHNYACQRCEPSATEIEKTAREGRKWGIGLVLASQRIRDLSPDVRGNINTVFFSRLQTYSDYQELRGWIEGAQYLEMVLPMLGKREFFVCGLANPLRRPVLMRVRDVE